MVLGAQCGCRLRTEPKSFAACGRPRTRLVWEPGHPPLDRGCVRPWGREGAAGRTGAEAAAASSSTVHLHQGFPAPTPAAGLPCPGRRDGEPWGPSTCTTAQPCSGKPERSPDRHMSERNPGKRRRWLPAGTGPGAGARPVCHSLPGCR